ncbi:hypothetical protein [Thiobaca trueperi]|uniref:Uncharacterized protein n=1 Tax=Thiobaca trueperi TaxID=127458 RepID=A0A4R3N3D1_9GAMM|nr:hypothetical protein [Thiobaca trueperi]TCT21179.1 hypothetical protein EDC35_10432 [Thiobaca trueperi]
MSLHERIQFCGVMAWLLATIAMLLTLPVLTVALFALGTVLTVAGLILDEDF